MCDVADAQTAEIAAAKLAVDGQVKHGEIANGMGILEVDADGGLRRTQFDDRFVGIKLVV